MCDSRASTSGTTAGYLCVLRTKYVQSEKSQLRFVKMFPLFHNFHHVIHHLSSDTQATYKFAPVYTITHAKLNYLNNKTVR